MTPLPLTRDLVLIGGGHTHALVLRRWGMRPLPGARLTLIDPGPAAAYSGMLPGFVAGHYPREALDIDLVRLARFAGARLIPDRAVAIDRDRRRVRCAGGREIAYDLAAIDIGITSTMPDLPGFAAHGVPAKPLGHFADRWKSYLARDGAAELAVIGGGVAGVELTLAMAHALARRGRTGRLHLIDAGPILTELPGAAARLLRRHLAEAGVQIHERTPVAEVAADRVTLADGRSLPADLIVGAAGARAWDWLADTGLALCDGFVAVDRTLRTSDPAIYATGDCAHLAFAPRPKAGVFAVRAAPVLAWNLRAELAGGRRRAFRPQGDYLRLVSLGARDALAVKWGQSLSAPWIWRWKDRIDRRFMDRFDRLTPMRPPALPRRTARGVAEALGPRPLCGGCGSKVGAAALGRSLAGLTPVERPDVVVPPGDDAAVIRLGRHRQVVTTDHLRAFTLDPWTMARIAAIHAMGDVWAMGAEPQAALATVILPPLSPALQERWLSEIMTAAADAFAEAGARLAGGHTTLGAELTLGFSVTGLLDTGPVTRAGARPGDALVLTRPIGSGTILAAEMALAAPGAAVLAVLETMARGQGDAAARLRGAHAMTDVTGFGLAGHLLGIGDASWVGAELWLDAIPLYDGAADLARAGVRSSLHAANAEAGARMDLPEDPRIPLLFDPQTAGGLLAAIPAKAADALVAGLRDDGHRAARIGQVIEGPPRITVT